MRALTAALLTELGLSVTRPGYLVQIGYSTVLRLSTMGTISWAGQTWAAANVKVSGISQDGNGAASGSLQLGNTDGAYGALVLTEGAADVPLTVWACYAGATASGDPVLLADCVADGAEIDAEKVTLTLAPQKNGTLHSPRVFISKPTFNFLQPAGTKIVAGGETFTLERA